MLCKWSREWLMLFNVDKCKILHLGHGNKMVPYTMNGVGLQAVQEEVDLGIVIQEDLKWAKQCAKVVGKANRTLGLIKRCFGHLMEDVFLKLYKSLVRPQLEYAVQAWRPHLQKDINLLEKVQGGLQS
jgi:ribonuclease P/MRP protein subunit RPP40